MAFEVHGAGPVGLAALPCSARNCDVSAVYLVLLENTAGLRLRVPLCFAHGISAMGGKEEPGAAEIDPDPLTPLEALRITNRLLTRIAESCEGVPRKSAHSQLSKVG